MSGVPIYITIILIIYETNDVISSNLPMLSYIKANLITSNTSQLRGYHDDESNCHPLVKFSYSDIAGIVNGASIIIKL